MLAFQSSYTATYNETTAEIFVGLFLEECFYVSMFPNEFKPKTRLHSEKKLVFIACWERCRYYIRELINAKGTI